MLNLKTKLMKNALNLYHKRRKNENLKNEIIKISFFILRNVFLNFEYI